jgi:arylsulfatase A-like enzyme
MRALLALSVCVLASFAVTPATAASAPQRPNIVVLLADDLGYGDLGAYGGRVVPTPHLDRLAREGVRFTDAYVTSPACAPSRLSLMSGAYTQHFGMTWNDDRSAHKLPDQQKLLPELLRAAGYRTASVGKWNITRPADAVFDEVHHYIEWESDFFPQPDGHYKGSIATKSPGFASSKTQGWGPAQENEEYLTDRLARLASEFIGRQKTDTPFLLYVGFNAVHSPWQGRAKDRARFAHLPLEVDQLYASMLAALDDGVGRILHTLREQRLEENTIVVFLSDNGPAKGGPHIEGWKPEWPKGITVVGSAGPLRGAKTDLFEGGIREPLLIRWPAQLKPGSTFRSPVIVNDLLPTLCAAAHAPVPATTHVDGVDLLPFLRGQRDGAPHETLYWKIKSSAALRRGDWKLLLLAPDWKLQLYNLREDIGEQRDLAAQNPTLARELYAAWSKWNEPLPPPARKSADPLPTYRPADL